MLSQLRISRIFIAWIAIFAILCHALMPAISRLHAASMLAAMAEACPYGDHSAEHASADNSHPSPLEKFNAPHCGFCIIGMSLATPPAFVPDIVVADIAVIAAHAVSVPNPKTSPSFAAPPRGPPARA
jgi:hypothetical protein